MAHTPGRLRTRTKTFTRSAAQTAEKWWVGAYPCHHKSALRHRAHSTLYLFTTKMPPPPPCVTFLLFLYGALDSHPVFPSHVASGHCFLTAAAAGAPAGVVCGAQWLVCQGCAGCGRMCRLRISSARYLGYWVLGLCWLLRGSCDCFCRPHTSAPCESKAKVTNWTDTTTTVALTRGRIYKGQRRTQFRKMPKQHLPGLWQRRCSGGGGGYMFCKHIGRTGRDMRLVDYVRDRTLKSAGK